MVDNSELSKERRQLKTVVNAIRVLEALRSSPEPLRLSEISTRTRLRKSTVHLLLSTLADFNFVQALDQSGYYRLGLGIFEAGMAAVDALSLPPELWPPMQELADRSLEAVSLAVRSGPSALIVKRYESAHVLRAEIGVGTRMPLHGSASGKCLLAAITPEQLAQLYPGEELPEATPPRIETKTELLQALEGVRRSGYATNKDEFVVGVSAIAAPVLDRDGSTVAALSIAGPSTRFQHRKWVQDLVATTERMSVILGYRKRSVS